MYKQPLIKFIPATVVIVCSICELADRSAKFYLFGKLLKFHTSLL